MLNDRLKPQFSALGPRTSISDILSSPPIHHTRTLKPGSHTCDGRFGGVTCLATSEINSCRRCNCCCCCCFCIWVLRVFYFYIRRCPGAHVMVPHSFCTRAMRLSK